MARTLYDGGGVEGDIALAEAAGISRQTMNAIEKGEYNPTIKLCRRICRILDKSLDDLFWEDDEDEENEK